MQSVSNFYKNHFGAKVYKISLDAGCTCPNRDGTLGTGGCIFCSASGSGDFTANRNKTVVEQVEEAKQLVDSKFPKKVNQEKKYIAYFQNFTNTYGDEDVLIKKFTQACNCTGIVGIAIGTRPDCLSEKMLKFLNELSKRFFVQLELGFQTSNEKSAEYIRRGYKNEVYNDAVSKIRGLSPLVHIVTHLIFGLPGESELDMMNSVKFVAGKTDGIKITVLYILKNTDLLKDYEAGKFKTLEMDEYFALVKKALQFLPESTIIHRLTGDPPKKDLVAPLWTSNKKLVINIINGILTSPEARKGAEGE